MKRENSYRVIIIVCSVVQILLSGLYLNSLSCIDNWSAVYAEDSKGYLLAADHFSGKPVGPDDEALMRYRLFSPALPFMASLMSGIMPVEKSFVLINIILWLAGALLLYEFIKTVFSDPFAGLTGSLIFTTSLPLIEWGMPVMVDMAAYFSAVLLLFVFIKYREDSAFAAVLYGLIAALEVLVKPTLFIMPVFLLLSVLSERRYMQACIISLCSLLPVVLVYRLLGLDINDFRAFAGPRHTGLFYLFSSAFFCFHWGWYFFFKGMQGRHPFRKYMLIYLLVFSLQYLVFVHNPRLFFLCFPAIIPFVVKGIRSLCPGIRQSVHVISCYILTSNILAVFHLYVMRTLGIRDFHMLKIYIEKFTGA